MGNPNVGKSVIFSRLTGIHVIASNYPGTTVSYTQGFMTSRGRNISKISLIFLAQSLFSIRKQARTISPQKSKRKPELRRYE